MYFTPSFSSAATNRSDVFMGLPSTVAILCIARYKVHTA